MVDRLDRLRLRTVVDRDHQDHDVGHLRATGAHLGERFVAGRVEEGDLAAVVRLDGVGADVLRDAARFATRDVRLADRVEERRLAVVDVAHDRHDRSAMHALRVVDDGLFVPERFRLVERDVRNLVAELGRDQRGGVGVDRLVHRRHHPHRHQLLHHVADLDRHPRSERADRDLAFDRDLPLDGLRGRDLRLLLALLRDDALAAAALELAGPERHLLEGADLLAGTPLGAGNRRAALVDRRVVDGDLTARPRDRTRLIRREGEACGRDVATGALDERDGRNAGGRGGHWRLRRGRLANLGRFRTRFGRPRGRLLALERRFADDRSLRFHARDFCLLLARHGPGFDLRHGASRDRRDVLAAATNERGRAGGSLANFLVGRGLFDLRRLFAARDDFFAFLVCLVTRCDRRTHRSGRDRLAGLRTAADDATLRAHLVDLLRHVGLFDLLAMHFFEHGSRALDRGLLHREALLHLGVDRIELLVERSLLRLDRFRELGDARFSFGRVLFHAGHLTFTFHFHHSPRPVEPTGPPGTTTASGLVRSDFGRSSSSSSCGTPPLVTY